MEAKSKFKPPPLSPSRQKDKSVKLPKSDSLHNPGDLDTTDTFKLHKNIQRMIIQTPPSSQAAVSIPNNYDKAEGEK